MDEKKSENKQARKELEQKEQERKQLDKKEDVKTVEILIERSRQSSCGRPWTRN